MPNEIFTVERIERAMDRLAACIANLGDDGFVFLPIYQRLESELETRLERDRLMERIRRRADALKPMCS